jgi:hypothetical protein
MPFKSGHPKLGGRERGARNKRTKVRDQVVERAMDVVMAELPPFADCSRSSFLLPSASIKSAIFSRLRFERSFMRMMRRYNFLSGYLLVQNWKACKQKVLTWSGDLADCAGAPTREIQGDHGSAEGTGLVADPEVTTVSVLCGGFAARPDGVGELAVGVNCDFATIRNRLIHGLFLPLRTRSGNKNCGSLLRKERRRDVLWRRVAGPASVLEGRKGSAAGGTTFVLDFMPFGDTQCYSVELNYWKSTEIPRDFVHRAPLSYLEFSCNHAWGACGRRFKSGRPDQPKSL